MPDNTKAKNTKVDCAQLQAKYEIPLELFLDAIALGMNDQEVARVTGLHLSEVQRLRQELGGVGSELDLTHKKDICLDTESGKESK
ncbi:MAG: hypothetical protein ACOX3A_06860 [bacterium]|jgi:hypothetical protein